MAPITSAATIFKRLWNTDVILLLAGLAFYLLALIERGSAV
jgi:hypothetical protein